MTSCENCERSWPQVRAPNSRAKQKVHDLRGKNHWKFGWEAWCKKLALLDLECSVQRYLEWKSQLRCPGMADQIYVNSSFTAGVFAEAFPLLPGDQAWAIPDGSKPMFCVNGGDEDEIARFLFNVCQGARRWIHSHFKSFQGFNWSIIAIYSHLRLVLPSSTIEKRDKHSSPRFSRSVSHVSRRSTMQLDHPAAWGIAWVSFPACAGSQGKGQVYFWGHFFPV